MEGFKGRFEAVVLIHGGYDCVAKTFGTSPGHLRKITAEGDAGYKSPGISTISAIADEFGISLNWLVWGDRPQSLSDCAMSKPKRAHCAFGVLDAKLHRPADIGHDNPARTLVVLRAVGARLRDIHAQGSYYGILGPCAIAITGDFDVELLAEVAWQPHDYRGDGIEGDVSAFALLCARYAGAETAAATSIEECLAALRSQRPKHIRKFGVALAATIFLIGAAFALNSSRFREGMTVLFSRGPQAAFDYYSGSETDASAQIGKAWAAYRAGHYAEAQDIVSRLIQERIGRHSALPQAYQILGYLQMREGQWQQAEKSFRRSLRLYADSPDPDLEGAQSCYLALAKLSLDRYSVEYREGVQVAIQYLSMATAVRETLPSMFYELEARVRFEQGDLDAALAQISLAYDFGGSDVSKVGHIHAATGLYYLLAGEVAMGIEYTSEAEGVAWQTQDRSVFMQARLNRFAYAHSCGIDTLRLRDELTAWARADGDWHMLRMVDCVLGMRAGKMPGGGTPDPPPDPTGGGGGD